MITSHTTKLFSGSAWVTLVLFVSLIAGAVNPLSPASAVGTGSLVGTVSNEAGEPIEGVGVYLSCGEEDTLGGFSANTSTELDGTYSFSGLEARSCQISAQKQGFAGLVTDLQLGSGQLIANLGLVSATGASLSGFVLGAVVDGNAEILAGAELDLSFTDGSLRWQGNATSGVDGSFTFAGVPHTTSGTYSLWVTPDQNTSDYFSIQGRTIEVSSGSNVQNYSLTPFPVGDASLMGQVRDELSSEPVVGASIALEYSLSDEENYEFVTKTATTDSEGFYLFENIFAGSYYSITINKVGYQSIESSQYRLRTEDTSRTRDFLLAPGSADVGSYSARFVNSASEPITDFSISAQLIQRYGVTSVAPTFGGNGEFTFENLPEGNYSFSASASAMANQHPIYREYSGTFVINAESVSSEPELLIMERFDTGTTTVNGQIWDSRLGAGISGLTAVVSRLDEEQPSFRVSTLADGSWSVANLPDGEYVSTYYSAFRQSSDPRVDSAYEQFPSSFFTVNGQVSVNLERVQTKSLAASTGSLTVTVRNAKTREIMSNSNVYIFVENSGNTDQNAQADAGGKVTFTNLYAADYKIVAGGSVIMGAALHPQVSIQPGQNKITIYAQTMENTGTIEGYVRDAEGFAVVNAVVSASWSYGIGCCAGDGYGPWDITDETGYYRIEDVTLHQELTLEAASTPGMIQFATTTKKLTLRGTETVEEILAVSAGASISGSALLPPGVAASGIQVELRDAATGEWKAFTQLAIDGTYLFERVSAGTYNVLFTDAQWPQPAQKLGSSFLAAGPGETQSISATASGAFDLMVVDSFVYEFMPVQLQVGGQITGQVKLKTGNEFASQYARDFLIRVYQLDEADWLPYMQTQNHFASGWQSGSYSIGGLPDGNYKLEFLDPQLITTTFDPVFSGQSRTLDSAAEIIVTNSSTTVAEGVFMEVKRPTIEPSNSGWNGLSSASKEGLRNEVEVVAGGSSGNKVRVGKAFVGEWVAVTLEGATSVASAAAANRFSRASAVSFATASVTTVSAWLQVNASGEIEVPSGLGLTDNQKVIVLDSLNQVVGWATYVAPSQASPGVIAAPTVPSVPSVTIAPRMSVAPAISGTAKVGKVLSANLGRWSAAPAPAFSYQWYRCTKPAAKPATSVASASCTPITRAQSRTYKLTNRDVGYSVLARVTGKNSVGSKVVFSASKKVGR